MTLHTDRISGALFVIFGLVLYFFIIPNFVENVHSGSLSPNAIPNAMAIIIMLGGFFLAVKPSRQVVAEMKVLLKAGMYMGLLSAGLYAISQLGFIYVAPVLSLVIMMLIGERRLFWLFAGAVAIPAIIWFLVEKLLERGLP